MLDLGQEDGVLEVQFNGGVVAVDLYAAVNHLHDLVQKAKDETEENTPFAQAELLQSRVRAYMKELGFGDVSGKVADRFMGAIFEKYDELKKTESAAPTPG